jgi:proteasome assembly chaperone (PAC2) family protein
MGHLTWIDHPGRRPGTDASGDDRPVMVVAFEGWNDAGDAATSAVEHLWESWEAVTIASIDPEEFYDFTSTRPTVRLDDDLRRVIDWPANEFGWADPAGSPGVVLVRGVEPQLRWRTFCDEVLAVAAELDCRLVLTLGALLADVAHTRPTPVFGNAYDDEVLERLGLEPSAYEGPTGIVGVLHAECGRRGIDSASLWAAVPAYVPAAPSPKAALALVQRAVGLIGASVPTTVLEIAAVSYEHQVSELVDEDEGTDEYVRRLEEQHDADRSAVQSADDLVDEVERFLREQ